MIDWNKAIEEVSDEQSFLRFLRLLHQESVPRAPTEDDPGWETETVREFLEAIIDSASDSDFGRGEHYGSPMLRQVAILFLWGRWKVRKDRGEDRD
ncbi:MAG TPA: hypothetical protein VGR02_02205 [Thermoanaerobaculia bacterium]|jgi:hypothetical protein|nr:hypothetical protein [Thermoanaerobaculia bacterium]